MRRTMLRKEKPPHMVGPAEWHAAGPWGALQVLRAAHHEMWLTGHPNGSFRIRLNPKWGLIDTRHALTRLLTDLQKTYQVELFFPRTGRGIEALNVEGQLGQKFDQITIRKSVAAQAA